MPLYANRFAGHLEDEDPRGPLSAAGGCTWPTIPAFRYWLISDDATGDLAFFNTDPVLIQFASVQPAHDSAGWTPHGANPFITFGIAAKLFEQGDPTYLWQFVFGIVAIPEAPLVFEVTRSLEKCNRDIPLPNVWAFDIDRGVTGDTFRMEQIEWDKTSPPP
jgi:hypothetical protein